MNAHIMNREFILKTISGDDSYFMYGIWIRSISYLLGHKLSHLLNIILSHGQSFALSRKDFIDMLDMDTKAFTGHREKLIKLDVITIIKGNSYNYATEYHVNYERVADIIIEGYNLAQSNQAQITGKFIGLPKMQLIKSNTAGKSARNARFIPGKK